MTGQNTNNTAPALNTKGDAEAPKKKHKPKPATYRGGEDGKGSHTRHRGNRHG